MSVLSRTIPSLSARKLMSAIAIAAVASIGLTVAAPGNAASAAENPNSPQARVSHAIESGHFLDEIRSGAISEADLDAAAKTGIDVDGQHIDKWMDLSANETAAANAKADELRAKAQADPKMAASLEATKADMLNAVNSYKAQTSTNTGGSIAESKHWWNHIIHWYTIYINHAWLRGLIGAAAGVAAGAVCAFFGITGFGCAVVAAVFSGAIAEAVKSSASCSGKGLYIAIPDDWNSHCEV